MERRREGRSGSQGVMTATPEKALSMAMREACAVHILVAKAICRHPELILTKPAEFRGSAQRPGRLHEGDQ